MYTTTTSSLLFFLFLFSYTHAKIVFYQEIVAALAFQVSVPQKFSDLPGPQVSIFPKIGDTLEEHTSITLNHTCGPEDWAHDQVILSSTNIVVWRYMLHALTYILIEFRDNTRNHAAHEGGHHVHNGSSNAPY
jgi:hypothetical protein